MLALFAGILIWEEVWDLPHTAALSGWLLLLITAGAMLGSAVFEKRLWCRYLCPIGAMNGLFAKGSMTEVRAVQGACAGERYVTQAEGLNKSMQQLAKYKQKLYL